MRPSSGDQQLFGADTTNFAVCLGAAYDLTGAATIVVRVAYGVSYDRPFDNLWQNLRNNDIRVLSAVQFNPTGRGFNYLAPLSQAAPEILAGRTFSFDFPDLTAIDPELKNGQAHTYFTPLNRKRRSSAYFI